LLKTHYTKYSKIIFNIYSCVILLRIEVNRYEFAITALGFNRKHMNMSMYNQPLSTLMLGYAKSMVP